MAWRRARRHLLAAARGYSEGEADPVSALLAARVVVRLPGGRSRSLSRSTATEALMRWRARWRHCDVLVPEMLWSGPLCAATCRIAGIRADGTPSSVDLGFTWRVGDGGVCRVDVVSAR